MKKKRSTWTVGDVFAIPLVDGTYGFGQVAGFMMRHVPYVVVFSDRAESHVLGTPPTSPRVIALLSTTSDLLNIGMWPVVGHSKVVAELSEFPDERYADNQYVGAKTYGSGIVTQFVEAYHGLLPWNAMYHEDYFDRMLAPGVERPEWVTILDREARAAYREQSGWTEQSG